MPKSIRSLRKNRFVGWDRSPVRLARDYGPKLQACSLSRDAYFISTSGRVANFALLQKHCLTLCFCIQLLFSLSPIAPNVNAQLPLTLRWDGARSQATDRTYYWIPAFDRVKGKLDRDYAGLANATREAISDEQEVAEKEIAAIIANTTRPWPSGIAIDVYRRIVRLAQLGKIDSVYVQAIEPTLYRSFNKPTVEVQNRVPDPHPTMPWPAQSYTRVESPHFEVTTQGSAPLATNVAILAEQTFAVWQQAFLPAWCEVATLEAALVEGRPLPETMNRLANGRLRIVLFKNREQYVHGLRTIQPNIGISTGFYHSGSKTVFCYWEENVSANVLRHEITHQLFSEASQWEGLAAEELPNHFWLIEGIALYMESLQIDPSVRCDRATLGGWDAPRLQAARYRRLHDEFWIPWEEFSRATSQQFQQGDSVRQHYSQAAGMTHFWMDHSASTRSATVDFIDSLYQQQGRLPELPYTSDDDLLRAEYDRFLLAAGKLSRNLPLRGAVREVVLSRCDVDSESILSWPQKNPLKLDWLDLSFTKVDDKIWTQAPEGRWDIRRLNLEGTDITDASIAAIASMNRLEELDLSTCEISNLGLEPLRGHRSLRKLWLTNTSVTEELTDLLATLPRLEEIELAGTVYTDKGRKELARRIPKLRRK